MEPYEIDALIAEKVLGYEIWDGCIVRDRKRSGIPSYSQKIEWAWKVVEKMQERYYFSLSDLPGNGSIQYIAEFSRYGEGSSRIGVVENTAPLAICKAALEALKGKSK